MSIRDHLTGEVQHSETLREQRDALLGIVSELLADNKALRARVEVLDAGHVELVERVNELLRASTCSTCERELREVEEDPSC